MDVTNASCAIGQFIFDALARQLQHPLTCVEAIDLDSRMEPQQLAKKSTIPLAHDKCATRRSDLFETSDATTLELIAKGEPLQCPVPRRDRVEVHAFITNSASSGVSRTRSANAVRWSRLILSRKESSNVSRSELTLTHAKA